MSSVSPKVHPRPQLLILMATYNGAAHLESQLASISGQTFTEWVMLVRDDGSTDATANLLDAWSRRDARIQVIKDGRGNLGAAGNFAALVALAVVRAEPWIAFSDQDDVWLVNKLEKQIQIMRALETRHGADVPALVYTDLEVVDESLYPISPSFMARQHIANPAAPPLTTVLVQNHVVGCTMLFNRTLLTLASPQPVIARMHDWWIALCAYGAGMPYYLDYPTVRYRQHRGNQIGAGGYARLLRVANWRPLLAKLNRLFAVSRGQAGALLTRLEERGVLASDTRTVLAVFASLESKSLFVRLALLRRLGFSAQNGLLTLLLYLQTIFLTKVTPN
jgi:glycosyltransferase involved in cell wall biosynthesis